MSAAERITLHHGDNRQVLKTLADNSVDAIVTDPPYGLGAAPDVVPMLTAWLNGREYAPKGKGFMGREWDAFVPQPPVWRECYRVLKPGGHLVAFFGTRTYDLGALAIRLAGFEPRDMLAWLYGSGFPKGLNLAKAIDRELGVKGEVVPTGAPVKRIIPGADQHKGGWEKADGRSYQPGEYAPASPEAAALVGFDIALKPALEPVVFARKPFDGTVAANVLKHGTGGLNIDGCRVAMSEGDAAYISERVSGFNATRSLGGNGALNGGEVMDRGATYDPSKGRWPGNVLHDGSPDVAEAFPISANGHWSGETPSLAGRQRQTGAEQRFDEPASAARFFYSAKADSDDRLGSKHPTVKPVDLMAWLCRLVTPPGGVVLDPFAGSGTTGAAAFREGLRAILIEREPEHAEDIRTRIAHLSGVAPHSQALKARRKAPAADLGPIFGSGEP